MSYAVSQYYQNGGSEAEIVRVANGASKAELNLGNGVIVEAASEGDWGKKLRARVDYDTADPTDANLYNLTVRDMAAGEEESFRNIVSKKDSPRALSAVLRSSTLVRGKAGDARDPLRARRSNPALIHSRRRPKR